MAGILWNRIGFLWNLVVLIWSLVEIHWDLVWDPLGSGCDPLGSGWDLLKSAWDPGGSGLGFGATIINPNPPNMQKGWGGGGGIFLWLFGLFFVGPLALFLFFIVF